MAILATVVAVWFAYLLVLAVYRVFVSPLAKFPGPKLAALSKWYEFYFEVVKNGQFSFHIQDLHKRYGPIVRITPDELHIQDSTFWEELYVRHPKQWKYEWTAGRFGTNNSVFTTSDPALHRVRRSALNSMFSKQALRRFEPVVQAKADYIVREISEYEGTGTILTIGNAFCAFAGDAITEYCFGFSYEHIRSKNFEDNFHEAFMAVSAFGHVALQFPWIHKLLRCIPDSVNRKMNPPLEKLIQLERDLRDKIAGIITETEKGTASPPQPTIFHAVLDSNVPASEKSLDRLCHEAQLVIGAGLETTSWALSVAVFYILSNRRVHDMLTSELRTAIPDIAISNAFDTQRLERIPYLSACIKEAIRFSLGVSARNPRVLTTPLTYDKWTIPSYTPVSMTIEDVHFDETIYKEAYEFQPERWLGDSPKALDGKPLEHYFVAFGKGPRACLGINLAYLEMFTVIARIFRQCRLELFETDVSDVKLAHDFFIPSPKLDSKGIRVKVLNVEI